ncbi:DUF5610 domain-containing protein [Rheinheimera sp. MMS21-TC3]|uniref:DUF5610 domain-containing protein n=1 Tax=Rheinheimera sp. MMS21-TC3 TaxID=3072790 RepID=UPI0028C449CB|nr:DUF5610 domain-containing protein [Rheinheimera sp. MMS21-TC3]WNO60217.1 DUF5610 domain-containing protein [Rheinheimera sp. MMS21-TC3]
MAITTGNTPITGVTKQTTPPNKADNGQTIKNQAAELKQANNLGILRAAEKVSLSSNNDSLSLLYKTALEGINAELEPIMGTNAAQKIYDSGIDTSPEATAERIVSFATAFYGKYKEQNPGKSEEENLESFLKVIGGGIEKGFADAKNILKGLQVYEGEVESGVDKTYGLVMDGLASFREKMLEQAAKSGQEDSNLG